MEISLDKIDTIEIEQNVVDRSDRPSDDSPSWTTIVFRTVDKDVDLLRVEVRGDGHTIIFKPPYVHGMEPVVPPRPQRTALVYDPERGELAPEDRI